jgi:molybdopterin-synthase adenylyltransferase
MIKLIFAGRSLDELAATFRRTDVESFALVVARPATVSKGNTRLLVESIHVPSDADYEVRSRTEVRPSAAFRLPIEKRARQEGLSLIYCHSHPGQRGRPAFSATDGRSEGPLAVYAAERVPGVPHAALLIGADQLGARELGTSKEIEVWQVGSDVRRFFPEVKGAITGAHDRQVRVFGKAGQLAVQSLRIAIVGCGGTGSIVTQELAHLGATTILLVDPDRLTRSNLNRVVGATPGDVGQLKVDIARRMIRRISPSTKVEAIKGDVLRRSIGRLLLDYDLIFCCTDSDGSRHFLNQLAYQYFIPVIDMGVSITPDKSGRIVSIDGRVQMLAPGLACLVCNEGALSHRHVMWDLQSARQRRSDPYFVEIAGIKQPAVIALNGTVASQAITIFLSAVAVVPVTARSIRFRVIRGDARLMDPEPRTGCVNCSAERGFLGKGNLHLLPGRDR